VSRPRAADDFATIRARIEQLRQERDGVTPHEGATAETADSDAERHRRARIEGWPPPWVPTIFIKQPPI